MPPLSKRLLAPWIMIVEIEIGAIAGDTANGSPIPRVRPSNLLPVGDLERSLRSASGGGRSPSPKCSARLRLPNNLNAWLS